MKGILSQHKREYVLFHLKHHVNLTPELLDRIIFIESEKENADEYSDRIIFYLSDEELILGNVQWNADVPILFPIGNKIEFFSIDEHGNLIFYHDILKSIFYLLSGYQEYANKDSKDQLERFSFQDAIQCKLDFIAKPVVNYYFKIIVKGLELFANNQKVLFQKRRLFSNFGFLLTHDIDYVDLYTSNYIIYKLKELFALRKSILPNRKIFQLFVSGFLKYIGIIKKNNPYWNFEFMRALERSHNFKSVFFFLDKGIKHSDAYYSFKEDRMLKLFSYLKNEQCEIGLHGSVESKTSLHKMQSSLKKLTETSNTKIIGCRQHRLLWNHPETAKIQKSAGLKYDTTLGFAAHEGFRNSYCLPFKLYDFDNDRMLDIWEFPMNVMDVTLFGYRKQNPEKAMESCVNVITEIQKFGGVFTVIWHNSFFDENSYPGITKFYSDLLQKLSDSNAESILGNELFHRIEKFNEFK